MYNPPHFRVKDAGRISRFVRENSFGTLFSCVKEKLFTSHLPFHVNDNCSELTGHMAKENPHWKFLERKEVLVEFMGPNHYISPTWYGFEGPVPTWNYAVVEMEGVFSAVTDPEEKVKIIDNLVAQYERRYSGQWSPNWNDGHYISMLERITAFKIEITGIEGKWKMSQNYPDDKRRKVQKRLTQIGSQPAMNVAEMMAEFNE